MRVLIICVHNSARSQMAETYLRHFCGEAATVTSAGLDPTHIHPLVLRVMAEDGFDLSAKGTRKVFDLFRDGLLFDYVITVCEESLDGQCPVFPGVTHRLHMPFADPAALGGSEEQRLVEVRKIRDRIKARMAALAEEIKAGKGRRPGDAWETAEDR